MSEPWRSTLGRRLYIALGVLVTLAGVLVVVVCVGTVIMLGPAAFDGSPATSRPTPCSS